jgi:hypothetical protein
VRSCAPGQQDFLTKSSVLQTILSLDISFNDFEDAHVLATQLGKLAALRNLVVHGNPMCLCQGYQAAFWGQLTNLILLDGKRWDSVRTDAAVSSTLDAALCNMHVVIDNLELHHACESSLWSTARAAPRDGAPPQHPTTYYLQIKNVTGVSITSTSKLSSGWPASAAAVSGAPPWTVAVEQGEADVPMHGQSMTNLVMRLGCKLNLHLLR